MYCITLYDDEVQMLRKAMAVTLTVANSLKAEYQLNRLTELNTTIEEQFKAQDLAKTKLKT